MSQLFSPIKFRDLTLKNRVTIAPMCQYSARHGLANDWHFAHLARFAIGGGGGLLGRPRPGGPTRRPRKEGRKRPS